MSDREFRDERSRFLRGMAADISMTREKSAFVWSPQLTETRSKVMEVIMEGKPVTDLPGGGIVPVIPMHHLFVFRAMEQAVMILTRVDPFLFEMMELSDLEMNTVMGWAKEMAYKGIGKFTPSDGGWFWWAK